MPRRRSKYVAENEQRQIRFRKLPMSISVEPYKPAVDVYQSLDALEARRREKQENRTQTYDNKCATTLGIRDGLKSHLFADAYFWSSENIRYKSVMYLLTYLLTANNVAKLKQHRKQHGWHAGWQYYVMVSWAGGVDNQNVIDFY